MASELQEFGAGTHAELIAARWVGLTDRLDGKLAHLADFDRRPELRMLNQAAQASSAVKRVHWLRKAADVATHTAMPMSACRKGCSHCCKIPVAVSRTEAQVIARETGRQLDSNAGAVEADGITAEMARTGYLPPIPFAQPCTFLSNDVCTIYEFRPLACRLQVNMDEDELLCILSEELEPKVPYLDLTHHHVAAAEILGIHQTYDDIRRWFPPGD